MHPSNKFDRSFILDASKWDKSIELIFTTLGSSFIEKKRDKLSSVESKYNISSELFFISKGSFIACSSPFKTIFSKLLL